MSLNIWTALKARYWKRVNGPSTYSGPGIDIAADNNFQDYVLDPNGYATNFLVPGGNARGRTHLNNPNGVSISGTIAAAGTPTVTPTGGVGTSWGYKIVARASNGTAEASSAGTTSTGGATLDGTHYNTVTWAAVTGAVSYDVYRPTASGTPSTTGYIGNTTGLSFVDTGLAGDSTTAPTVNTTGTFEAAASYDLAVIGLASPQGLTITPTGTPASTAYGYRVSAVTLAGTENPSAAVTTSTGAATLTTTNYNALSWKGVPGAISYNVYRSSSSGTPGTTGLIGNVTAVNTAQSGTYSLNDTGLTASGSVPTGNGTGTITATGGVVATTTSANQPKHVYAGGWVPAATTSGTDTAAVDGTVWISEVILPASSTLTGIAYLLGSVGGTDKVVVILFDATGAVVANSALNSSVTAGTTATFQRVPFTTPYKAVGPAKYYIGVVFNGTTAKVRTQVFGNHDTGTASQTFNTPAAITPPTTFTASNGPVSMLY